MITTITGDNDFQRTEILKQLTTDFVEEYGDMALEQFDGEDSTFAQMLGGVQSLPFLATKKLVVLREPNKQKEFVDNVSDIIAAADETTDVIIYEPKLDRRSVYYKTLLRETNLKDCKELDSRGLEGWAKSYASKMGGVISAGDVDFLVQRIGTNQQLLKSELDKLLSYDSKITRSSIELLTEPLPQSTTFDLLDAAFAGQKEKVMNLYREQRLLKVEPQVIVGLISWQLHALALVKSTGSSNVDEIAYKTGQKPFVIRKALGLVKNKSFADIKKLIGDLAELDLMSKRSSIDADEALQLYLLKLCV